MIYDKNIIFKMQYYSRCIRATYGNSKCEICKESNVNKIFYITGVGYGLYCCHKCCEKFFSSFAKNRLYYNVRI